MKDIKIDIKKLVKRVPVDKSDNFIGYEEDKCNGCGKCADVCSVGLWTVKEGKARLSKRYRESCLECAACWEICDQEAIDFSYPKGGTGVVIEYG